MTKSEILNNMADKTAMSVQSCEKVLDAFIEEVKECLSNDDKLMIKGFMSFEVTKRPERDGRNPQTGEIIKFKPVKSVKCRISKSIKDAINGK